MSIILVPLFTTIACGLILGLHGVFFNCVLGVAFASSLIIAVVAAKWRASLINKLQLQRLESAALLDIEKVVPAQASFAKHPRKVVFNENVAGNPPIVYQIWMLTNPLVWIMLFYLFNACTIDEELKKNGQIYAAKLIRASQGDQSHQNKGVTTHSVFQQKLIFEYAVKNKPYQMQVDDCHNSEQYKLGESYSVRALPDKPLIHEPMGEERGAKQKDDFYAASLFLIANLFFEFCIWYQPLRHLRLAKIGEPVPVRIKKMTYLSSLMAGAVSSLRPSKFIVLVERLEDSTVSNYEIELDGTEYCHLQVGAIELALLDPLFKRNATLYRFCKYQVVD